MIKIKYLKQTVETYVVVDPKTRGEFKVVVTEGVGDIHFQLEHSRVMSSDGIAESIALLKELIQNDCFNPIGRNGEKVGKKKVVKTNIDVASILKKVEEYQNGPNQGKQHD